MRYARMAALAPITACLLTSAVVAPAEIDLGPGTFLGQTRRAMDRMTAGMATPASGDTDSDFAAMMIPHHQGAIDMAVAELRFGHDERLRRIAQEIIVEQQQEIVVMQGVLAEKTGTGHKAAEPGATHTMVMP